MTIRVFSYNVFDADRFPYPSGPQQVGGVPVFVMQGIFTRSGKKSPEYVTREDPGYKTLFAGLVAEDTVIPFFGKEPSGASAALDLILEDRKRIGFRLVPIFCRHVDVLEQAKLIALGIPYRIFIDYAKQCEEWNHLEDALLGEAARIKRAMK